MILTYLSLYWQYVCGSISPHLLIKPRFLNLCFGPCYVSIDVLSAITWEQPYCSLLFCCLTSGVTHKAYGSYWEFMIDISLLVDRKTSIFQISEIFTLVFAIPSSIHEWINHNITSTSVEFIFLSLWHFKKNIRHMFSIFS